jgi:enamine deaminase RidA (YjgF/YER057c/UK114 family)
MTKIEIHSDLLSTPAGVFSQGIEVPMSGRMLFLSGMTSRNQDGSVFGAGDIVAQTERCLDNIVALLQQAGASMDDVVSVTVYVRDMGHFEAIHEVRRRYFSPPLPSSTMVEVSGLALPEMLIEITATAVRHA